MTVLEDVKEHIRKLINFQGRESRVDFWVWAITMAIVVSTITTGIVAWRTFAVFDQILDAGGFVRIRNIFIDARLWTVGGFFVAIAAATARRLHDVGRSALTACIPAALTVGAFWLFGELFKGLPDPIGDSGILTNPLEVLDGGIPRQSRVWDASGGDLALCAGFTVAAAITAIPVLIGLVRKGEAEANKYGLPPTDQIPPEAGQI